MLCIYMPSAPLDDIPVSRPYSRYKSLVTLERVFHLGMFVPLCVLPICLSVRIHSSRTIVPIHLIVLYKKFYTRGSDHL